MIKSLIAMLASPVVDDYPQLSGWGIFWRGDQ